MEGPVFVAVVCDGAGSAAHSDIASKIACHCAHSQVKAYLDDGLLLDGVDTALAENWLSIIRERLVNQAWKLGVASRELATTISIAIAGRELTIIIVVGDSPCIVHDGCGWVVPILPMKGEYANQTYFVTQDPIPCWSIKIIDSRIDQLAVFTDGIDNLVLREQGREVFQPFFDSLFEKFPGSSKPGQNRETSINLASFLSSDRVNSLTDDDKTLMIARRLKE